MKYIHLQGFQISARKETMFVVAHVWQIVIPRNLKVYQLVKLSARKDSHRETHKILRTSPMNAQP